MKPEQIAPLLNSFEVYLKSNRVTPQTIKTYMPVAKKFLEGASELSEGEFRTYQANSYDMKNNTALRNYYALAALFKSQNVAFEVKAPPGEDHPSQPALKEDDMKRLILAIKAGGTSEERGLLALSSVYGLRRVELSCLVRADLDFNEETITIRAAKHGRERTHKIPSFVFSFVAGLEFKPLSSVKYSMLFWDIIRKAGVNVSKGYGWHSIRRALYTGFVKNEFDYYLRHEFMRWRTWGDSLDQTYARLSPWEIDALAFEKHPFLKWWQ